MLSLTQNKDSKGQVEFDTDELKVTHETVMKNERQGLFHKSDVATAKFHFNN